MLENKNYCDKDTSVALKELGYNYPLELITDYFGVLDTPFHEQKIHLYNAQKWLREEKKIYIDVACNKGEKSVFYNFEILTAFKCNLSDRFYSFYEEALSEGIKEAVKILKEK
jgi:hypothetical protein